VSAEHDIISALAANWKSLADEFAPAWPDGYWRLRDLLRAYLDAAQDTQRADIGRRVLKEVQRAPAEFQAIVKRNLSALQKEDERRRQQGEDARAGEADSVQRARAEAMRALAQEVVTRYTDVQAPAQVQVGKRFAVIVGLTRAPADDAQDPQALQVELNKLIKVVLTPRPPLESLGEQTRTLHIRPNQDSEPAVFYLRARESGPQGILIDFYSSQALLISQTISLEAVEEGVAEALTKYASASLRVGDYFAPPPDLILRVDTQGSRLIYHLLFSDTCMLTIEGESLRADPREFRQRVMKEIEALRRDGRGSGDEVFRELARIGQGLYRQLFPEALRRKYCQFRSRVRTLELISDEPWIPWELVKPYELAGFDGPNGFEDDFLCARFDFSRWVMPNTAPAAEIQVHSLACIAPMDSGLPAATQEAEFVRALARNAVKDASPESATRPLVLGLLEGGVPISLWHFACHGNYDDHDPEGSPLHLQAKDCLYPKDLIGPTIESRLSADRPLVFLNACRVGSMGLGLTALAGWAKQLIECRAGAVIAPLWVVSDEPARHFAEAFYKRSQQPGCTLAQAMRGARDEIRKRFPGDPTWLAYSLFAHPNARLRWT
jgi:hypothetical protein